MCSTYFSYSHSSSFKILALSQEAKTFTRIFLIFYPPCLGYPTGSVGSAAASTAQVIIILMNREPYSCVCKTVLRTLEFFSALKGLIVLLGWILEKILVLLVFWDALYIVGYYYQGRALCLHCDFQWNIKTLAYRGAYWCLFAFILLRGPDFFQIKTTTHPDSPWILSSPTTPCSCPAFLACTRPNMLQVTQNASNLPLKTMFRTRQNITTELSNMLRSNITLSGRAASNTHIPLEQVMRHALFY